MTRCCNASSPISEGLLPRNTSPAGSTCYCFVTFEVGSQRPVVLRVLRRDALFAVWRSALGSGSATNVRP